MINPSLFFPSKKSPNSKTKLKGPEACLPLPCLTPCNKSTSLQIPTVRVWLFSLGAQEAFTPLHIMLQSIFPKKESMHPALYVIQQLPPISHLVVCICPYYFLNSSHPPLHLLSPQVLSVHQPLYSNLIIF